MATGWRVGLTAVILVLLSGCSFSEYLDSRDPALDRTIEPAAPATSEESPTALATPDFSCQAVPSNVLEAVEAIGNVGGAVRFRDAQMVPAGGQWWAVAVRVWVEPGVKFYPSSGAGTIEVFITNAPSKPDTVLGSHHRSAPFAGQAKFAARRCVEKLG
jgi:hypothetical protein